MPGRMLNDRYELIEPIGGGGMALVHRALDHETNRTVAVKILRSDLAESEEFVERFKREAHASTTLDHPNIVKAYDVGCDQGDYYIVMEYVKGTTLKRMISAKGHLDMDMTLKIGLQIARALAHAHDSHIVHRDIKPQNILVEESGVIKVADFGIARGVAASTVTTMAGTGVMGSVHYFSPEQARGRHIDYRTDIYALGIVLYEMITGHLPFEGENAVEVAIKHIQEDVRVPDEYARQVPPALRDVIHKATRRKKEERYQDIHSMIADLEAAMENPYQHLRGKRENGFSGTRVLQSITPAGAKKWDAISKKKPTKWGVALGIAIPLLIIALIIWLLLRGILTSNGIGGRSAVPTVTGMSVEIAQALAEEHGYTLVIDGEERDEVYGDGLIIRQDPQPDTTLRRGGDIHVIVSSGLTDVSVPGLSDMPLEEAKQALLDSGLTVGEVEYVSDQAPRDTVIAQFPLEGITVEQGATVDLTVSLGPETREVKVGSYVGNQENMANALIHSNDLTLGQIFRVYSETQPAGLVIGQNPPANDMVEEFSEVDLWISLGPSPYGSKVLTVDARRYAGHEEALVAVYAGNILIYEGYPPPEGKIDIPVSGEGQVTYQIYVNGDPVGEQTITFESPEEGQ